MGPRSAIEEIAAARAAFVAAIRLGDASAVAGLYGEDARLLAPEVESLRGRDDVTGFWRGGLESGIRDVELEPDDVEVAAGVAWEVGRYALRLQPESGEAIADVGRYLLIYALAGGHWQRAAEMFSPDVLSAGLEARSVGVLTEGSDNTELGESR